MEQSIGIRSLAEKTGLSPHTLRYYESEGLMIAVPRDSSGRRSYDESHVRWVSFLRRLRDAGMGVARLREYVGLIQSGSDPDREERLRILQAHREEVRALVKHLTEHLQLLDRKIAAGCEPDQSEQPRHGDVD